jgi:hypothetical protein
MICALHIRKSRSTRICPGDRVHDPDRRLLRTFFDTKIGRGLFLLSTAAVVAGLSVTARSQSSSDTEDSSGAEATTISGQLDQTYARPTHRTKVKNYLFDAYGPFPIAGAAFAAGINQLSNTPPDWHQGAEGFSKRFGSNFAIATIGTTTRFGLAEALKEDTLYYRCECSGVWPRLGHAVISTLTARRGEDGHRIFSVPALLGPYAGSMTAVHGWYPDRYNAKDAFRMGNYTLLANVGGNIALEFLYSGPRSLLSRLHLKNWHNSQVEEPSQ